MEMPPMNRKQLTAISHRSTDEVRARQLRAEHNARRQELDEALDQFQGAILEASVMINPTYGAACRIGQARRELIAVIEKHDPH